MSAALRQVFDTPELQDPAAAGDEQFKLARLMELRAVIGTLRCRGDVLLRDALDERPAPEPS
jgi:hypothetical protein